MRILCLNCRGLGQPETIQEVRSLIKLHRPSLVFLSETRLFNDRVDSLLRSFNLSSGVGVGSYGKGGGLALLWTRDVKVKLQSYDKIHIDVVILNSETNKEEWRFTGFYGESRRELRHRSWELLRLLNDRINLPWLCAGDFNEVLQAAEQLGGNVRSECQMEGFRNAVTTCGFCDLGFSGLPYTWDNRQAGNHNIKVRLDRGLATQAFLDLYPCTTVTHVQTIQSDHCCLLIECKNQSSNRWTKMKCFRYENMWRRHESYFEIVQQAWGADNKSATLSQIGGDLKLMQRKLQEWDFSVFGSVRKSLAKLRKDLELERKRSIEAGPSRKERHIISQILELLSREEIMEKQRSRMDWLKDGDRNTSFFQAKCKERARRNQIRSLITEDGSVLTEQDLERYTASFYYELFSAQQDLNPDGILRFVQNRVSEEMNDYLTKPFTPEDVEQALFMMGPDKAPGPDGFTAGFYQTHWELLGPSITRAVLHFLNEGVLSEDINSTTIVLIPKTDNPQSLKQYRPISLCNVLYKICSKVLANRLRAVLDSIISHEQSAFVPGRLITDNVLIAYECTHYLKRKKGKNGACAIKLDMAKAYDRVEWNYLEGIMTKLGFHENFVQRIMKCVTSVSLSVKVNGRLSEYFRPTRGIRQGDPISPYLFLLCAEGPSSLLKSKGPMHLSRGVRVSIHSPWISHLLFADDCIVFSEASQRGADRLKQILDIYHKGSGQMVNHDKSAIFFSKNSSNEMKQEVKDLLQIQNEALVEKYLGLPTMLGRATKEAFEYMPMKIKGLVGSWSGREVSSAGREILLKSKAQAIPTYPMSCFQIPLSTCNKIKSIVSNYWWGGSGDNKHIHWMRWDLLTRPKAKGGMGFRDLPMFNKALLGKQGWRILTRPESLCAKVLKGRYYPKGDFLSANKKRHSSQTWRAISTGREVLHQGLVRRIGDGRHTNIWQDKWIYNHPTGNPLTPKDNQSVQLVADLLTSSGQWNVALIRELFCPFDMEAILKTPLNGRGDDFWAWDYERTGVYSVRSAYRLLESKRNQLNENETSSSSSSKDWKAIWKLEVPPKVKVFWWRVIHEFLPAREILHRRHIERVPNCEVCGEKNESIKHVLMDCTVARSFWESTKTMTGVKLPKLHELTWARDLLQTDICPKRNAAIILCGMWSLWRMRNNRRHGEVPIPVSQAVQWVKDTACDLWQILHPTNSKTSKKQQCWRRPRTGWHKCNVDGAYNMITATGAIGVIIRDHDGNFVSGRAKWCGLSPDAMMMEAIACREGIQLACEIGVTKLCLETDCLELVNLWKELEKQRSNISLILHDIKTMSRSFEEFILCHTNRSCNRVAHECTKQVSNELDWVEWHQNPPSLLQNLLNDDCNHVLA